MKKRYVAACVVLCLFLAAGVFLGPRIWRVVRVCQLAEEFLTRQSQSLDVTVMTEGNKDLTFRLDWQIMGSRQIFTLQASGETFFFCDGVIYLQNGKGYRFSEAIPDPGPLLEKPWLLIPLVQIQHEGAQWLLSVNTEEFLPRIRNLNVLMEEGETGIRVLQLNTWGQEIGDFVGLRALVQEERQTLEVPQAVLDAMESGQVQAGKDLTGDMLRLIRGWMLLNSKDPLGLELDVRVDLLELPLSTRLTLSSTNAGGKSIRYLNKDGIGFYFTDGAACTPEGVRIGTPDSSVDMAQLPGLMYYLCLNGEFSCQEGIYRLDLDRDGMERVLFTIVPEARDMPLTLTEGMLELRMEGEEISSMAVSVSGQVDLVIAKVDIGAGVNIAVVQEDFTMDIPQKVLDVLLE